MKNYVNEIIKLYENIDEGNRIIGKYWYLEANKVCRQISSANNLALVKVCGMMSALSVFCEWKQNIKDTKALIKDSSFKVNTFSKQKMKALNILDGEPDYQKIKSILNGEKTKAFFLCLLYPNISKLIVIDRWILRTLNIKTGHVTKKIYLSIARGFRQSAKKLNIKQYHQLQAALWTFTRDSGQYIFNFHK